MDNHNDETGTIKRIESLGGQYNPDSILTLDDQLWICESLIGELTKQNNQGSNENANVKWNGNVNVPHKLSTNSFLTEERIQTIYELTKFNYKTPPIQIAENLLIIFDDQNSKENHWLYLAQKWNPKSINGVISQMVKEQEFGWKTIQNPAGYFTDLIKYRPKRKVRKP